MAPLSRGVVWCGSSSGSSRVSVSRAYRCSRSISTSRSSRGVSSHSCTRLTALFASSGKGFGGSAQSQSSGGGGASGENKKTTPSSSFHARSADDEKRVEKTNILAAVMQSKQPAHTAAQFVDQMDANFFESAQAFAALAQRENNKDAYDYITRAISVCLSAKNSKLRPELRLFNEVASVSDSKERARILTSNRQHLSDGYFISVVEEVVRDLATTVENAPALAGENARKNLDRARSILSEARAVVKDGASDKAA